MIKFIHFYIVARAQRLFFLYPKFDLNRLKRRKSFNLYDVLKDQNKKDRVHNIFFL